MVDAVTALGLLERHGDKYRNGEVAQAYLSGRGPVDMRPFIRFWNRLCYKRWLALEDSVRKGQGVAGEFHFTPEEQKIFSEGVESFSAGHALALAAAYDFSRYRRVLDLGGGTGSFLKVLLQRYPQIEGTLYELPTAAVARQRLGDDPLGPQIKIVEGDFLKDPLPKGHDAVLLAHVVYVLVGAQPGSTPSRAAGGCSRCAPAHCRFLDEPYPRGVWPQALSVFCAARSLAVRLVAREVLPTHGHHSMVRTPRLA